jgi:TonB-dependent starch-binding outer membrane protein SusC
VYVGPNLPVAEMSLFTGLEIFNRKVRIQGLVDAKVGGYQLNGTERIRCDNRLNCRGVADPTAPLWEQARAIVVRTTPSRSQHGYVEKTDFLRFREVSVTYTLPDAWARLISASRATVSAAGRNLGVLTNYTGLDPESGYFSTNTGLVSDFQTQPPPTLWTFKVNVTF